MGRLLLLVLAAALLLPAAASASSYARFGLQDDAWLAYGPGTLDERLDELEGLGVDVVRYSLRWDEIAPRKPRRQRDHADLAYAWGAADPVLAGLRARGITVLLGFWGTPRWAGDGAAAVPRSKWTVRNFAHAAASRYPWVRHWLVWNEPNKRMFLRPASPELYVRRLLNPAYAAIHAVNPRAKVAGGVTAPRGGRGGVSPVDWIRRIDRAGARLDAYAHHPYPLSRGETPQAGGCGHCSTITLATLERLLVEVRRAFGAKRVWLTEYGYQTNPPDRSRGVSQEFQARYLAEAARRVVAAPRVDFLIHYLYRDEPVLARWQSGLVGANGVAKLAHRAFRQPLAQVSRRGGRTVVWGQVRPRSGRQPYRLQVRRGGAWRWVGGTRATGVRGSFTRQLSAAPGTRVRLWSPRDRAFGATLVVR
jgi:hypothetical protein